MAKNKGGRRPSEAAAKTKVAQEMTPPEAETAPVAATKTAPKKIDKPAPKPVPAGAMVGSKGQVIPRSIPNKPSFDWTKVDGEFVPNIATDQGEEITEDSKRKALGSTGPGIHYVRTNRVRFIFLCTAAEYEAEFGKLGNRIHFELAFPQAFEEETE